MSDKPAQDALTHVDASGRVKMVDVGVKDSTDRRAVARGTVMMNEATLDMVTGGQLKKGNALELARVAGIMAAKKTSGLIPLCHPLNLSHVNVEVLPQKGAGRIDITAEAACTGQTGVEMEALTAVSIAALTLYDMVKAVDRGVVITDIMLVSKSGGRSGLWERPGL